MKWRVRNARGIEVTVSPVTTDELLKCGDRLANELSFLPEVAGVMIIGSCAYSCPDEFSDLDLKVFTKDDVALVDKLDEICRKMGGVTDDEVLSIHFPFDHPAYLFDGLYVELDVLNTDKLEEMIESVLAGKSLDNGLVYSLRAGKLLFDRDGEIANLQKRLLSLDYPDALAKMITSVCLDIPMKMLVHSVGRSDYPQAMEWLVRLYYDSVRVIFAKNACFFPGMKRTLLRTVPQLPNVQTPTDAFGLRQKATDDFVLPPEGFCEYWEKIFSSGVSNWSEVVERVHTFVGVLKEA